MPKPKWHQVDPRVDQTNSDKMWDQVLDQVAHVTFSDKSNIVNYKGEIIY